MAKNNGIKLLKCSCVSDYQDKQYGKNVRVHNGTENTKRPGWRCTKCGTERAS